MCKILTRFDIYFNNKSGWILENSNDERLRKLERQR